jgi:2,4-dienoyl-CoA reductase-like NADH-dependent reductase (Old Yellow Enzyme family)
MTHDIANSSGKRIFFLGVNTGYITDGLPDSRYVEFYRQRSSHALHCAIIGNVVVPRGFGSNDATPTITADPVWGEVAAAIAAGGSLPGIQLATSWSGYVGTHKFVGGDPVQVIADARSLVDGLGRDGIAAVVEAFEEAATMAVDHGFRHVQLHAAHGYLLSLLIDRRINPRNEETLESLSRLAERLAASTIETSLRISLISGDPAFDAVGAASFQDRVAALPFDFIDLSSGFYNIDKRLIYPSRPEVIADRHSMTVEVARRHPYRNFILSGRAMQASELLPDNLHVGLCRDLIANPRFLAQISTGCQNRSKCHYFSRGEQSLRCALWDSDETSSERMPISQ